MKKSKSTFHTFIDEVRDDILKLLSFFNREETFSQEVLSLFLLSFLRLEVSIDTHETCHSSYIFISKSLQILEDSQT